MGKPKPHPWAHLKLTLAEKPSDRLLEMNRGASPNDVSDDGVPVEVDTDESDIKRKS